MRPSFWFLGYVHLFYPLLLKSEHFSYYLLNLVHRGGIYECSVWSIYYSDYTEYTGLKTGQYHLCAVQCFGQKLGWWHPVCTVCCTIQRSIGQHKDLLIYGRITIDPRSFYKIKTFCWPLGHTLRWFLGPPPFIILTHSIWQIQLWWPRSKWNMGEILAFLA